MSTENDELRDREATLGKAKEESKGIFRKGFHDPSGQYPRSDYFYGPNINQAARGVTRNDLYTGGGNLDLDLDLDNPPQSLYPLNQVDESRSGHVIEIDDTPSGERILIRHRTGAGVEMRTDGTILVTTRNNHITIVQGDNKLIVEGDAQLTYNGNLDIDVAGDYNLNVGGNFNVDVAGDIITEVDGNVRDKIHGNFGSNVDGNRSSTTTGTTAHTTLGGYNNIVKGDFRNAVEGATSIMSSGQTKVTSETRLLGSAPDMNLAAQSMSVFGDTGTIGGQNIVMYNYNMYTGHSITATDTISTNTAIVTERVTCKEFVGSLTGNADNATEAGRAGSAPLGPGGSAGTKVVGTPTAVDPKATALPTQTNLNGYLTKGAFGFPKVKVDPGAGLLNSVSDSEKNDGITNKPLSLREIRSKLRDDATLSNPTFTGSQVGSGKLSGSFSETSPKTIGRTESKSPTKIIGNKFIGQLNPVDASKKIVPKPLPKIITPDPVFNPNFKSTIDSKTKLGRGISLARFLGGKGDKITLKHIETLAEKKAIARQLYLQAEAINLISGDAGKFKDHRLVVVEGLYRKGPSETLTPGSINDLQTKGQAVVYELVDLKGKTDLEKSFDLAIYFKDNLYYEKLILDYDTFDPSGAMNVQIIIIMPSVTEDYTGEYTQSIETRYNNKVQSNKEFIEITL